MEKLTIEIVQQFLIQNEFELKATQEKLSFPVLNRIFKKMKGGIIFSDISVKDGIICNGHHRYIASILADYVIKSSPGVTTSATLVVPWKSVLLLEDDYDTKAGIEVLNQRDAKYNNLSEDDILELLK